MVIVDYEWRVNVWVRRENERNEGWRKKERERKRDVAGWGMTLGIGKDCRPTVMSPIKGSDARYGGGERCGYEDGKG